MDRGRALDLVYNDYAANVMSVAYFKLLLCEHEVSEIVMV